jgi:hypothetical protein
VGFQVAGTNHRARPQAFFIGLGLLLSAACLSACGPKNASGSSATQQKVEAMMAKMGVPGASSTPIKAAVALDCPPIKAMLDEVRNAPDPIVPASRQALNAWAKWCNLKPLADQAS